MNHLTDEQLAAHLDAQRDAESDATLSAAPEATSHLNFCESCRARLAELSSLDESLARALAHDPGEAYFATFADRVAERIAETAAAPASAPAKRGGLFAWWNSPRGLALDPGFNLHRYRVNALSDNPVYLAGRERSCEGMRLAGVPER